MQTWEEQESFFDAQWPALRQALETGGGAGAAQFVLSRSDELERRVLFAIGASHITQREWQGNNLDDLVTYCDAGIAECLRQAGAEADSEMRGRRKDTANVISYNLAASLADCWGEGDERERHQPEQRHFERGLKAAQDCIRWRLELDKGAWPFAIAYWAEGMHLLSLGRAAEAVESFRIGLEFSRQVARDNGLADAVGSGADFGVNLAAGYLGLARHIAGMSGGTELYQAALAAFEAQLEDPEHAEDAKFGIQQLQTVEHRYARSAANHSG